MKRLKPSLDLKRKKKKEKRKRKRRSKRYCKVEFIQLCVCFIPCQICL